MLLESDSKLSSWGKPANPRLASHSQFFLPHIPSIPTKGLAHSFTMAIRRPELDDETRAKRQKTSGEMDPSQNPYLAHMYENESTTSNGYAGSYDSGYNSNNSPHGFGMSGLPRHKSTTAQAQKSEDGPNNPFTGQPLSRTYFDILKTRRNLPVHSQRFVIVVAFYIITTN